ncbi:MAG: hypothetical protein ACP5XB_00195 [Isosphaeraceae bacterium]
MGLFTMFFVCAAQVPVGPLDAFRANFYATKVDIRFRYEEGMSPAGTVDRLRSGAFESLSVVLDPQEALNGRWSCDGTTELLACSSLDFSDRPDKAASPTTAAKAKQLPHGGPVIGPRSPVGFEVFTDGEMQAENRIGHGDVQVMTNEGPGEGMFLTGRGPFCWWGTFHLPASLERYFGSLAPTLHRTSIGGRSLAVSVYQIDHPQGGWGRMEITYDPAVNFLPRHVRLIGVSSVSAQCKEMFLVEAKPCAEGGFVPLEYYTADFLIDPPKHREITEFDPGFNPRPTPKIVLGHFKVNEFKDKKGRVGLSQLQKVHTVVARGGAVPLLSKSLLTLDRIKSILTSKLKDPWTSRRPNLDVADMDQFTETPRPRWIWPVAIALPILLLAAVVIWRRRRARLLGMLLAYAAMSSLVGCGKVAEPRVTLHAEFDPPQVVFSPHAATVSLSLVARNDGNVQLKVFKVDAGCQCRRVDMSDFPITLAPGRSRAIGMTMRSSPRVDLQHYLLRFETDQGTLNAPVSVALLCKHSFHPDMLGSATLIEQDEWESELVHRALVERGHEADRVVLDVPPELEASKVGTHRGRVDVAPHFEFIDTTYRLALKDKSLGLKKALIGIKSTQGERLLEYRGCRRCNSVLLPGPPARHGSPGRDLSNRQRGCFDGGGKNIRFPQTPDAAPRGRGNSALSVSPRPRPCVGSFAASSRPRRYPSSSGRVPDRR